MQALTLFIVPNFYWISTGLLEFLIKLGRFLGIVARLFAMSEVLTVVWYLFFILFGCQKVSPMKLTA